MTKDLEASLSELGADVMGISYLHAADRSVPFGEALQEVDKLHKEGRFERLGLGNYSAYEIAEIAMTCTSRRWTRLTIFQGSATVMGWTSSDTVRYVGAVDRQTQTYRDEGRYDTKGFLGPIYRSMYFKDGNFQAIGMIETAAEKHGLTLVEPLSGVGRIGQLGQNPKGLDKGPLPTEAVESLEVAWIVAQSITFATKAANVPSSSMLAYKSSEGSAGSACGQSRFADTSPSVTICIDPGISKYTDTGSDFVACPLICCLPAWTQRWYRKCRKCRFTATAMLN
ncbi:hypothetical protein FQN53_007905 [Emmonsiellopsis sp. PD_33]|nr:hypothetical protein FQN53_007905 [Emmonsiellopsis sp. PD_33]